MEEIQLIEHVVLAEFDIDTGSTVRYQYPSENSVLPPGVSNDWLAENMLPEGLHNRAEDWTYMFLNRESPFAHEVYRDVNRLDKFLFEMIRVRDVIAAQ